jgi:hypothetical protein
VRARVYACRPLVCVCMYVFMYVFVCVCMYVCIYAHARCLCECMCVSESVCVREIGFFTLAYIRVMPKKKVIVFFADQQSGLNRLGRVLIYC